MKKRLNSRLYRRQREMKTGFRLSGLVLMGILISSNPLIGQQDIPYTEEITVISPYKPTIAEASKININPRIELQNVQKPVMEYSIQKSLAQTTFDPQPLKPVAIVGEPIARLYRNFIRGGIGNYMTPYLEFFASSLRSREHAFGVHVKHLSSGEMKNHPSSSQSANAVDLWGKKFRKNSTLTGNLYYHRKMVHYYGYNDSLAGEYDISKDNLKQAYNIIGFRSGLDNTAKPDKVKAGGSLGYEYFFDRHHAQEHHADLQVSAGKDVALMDATDRENISLRTGIDVFSNKDSLTHANSAIITLEPAFRVSFNEYTFLAGVNATAGIDSGTKMHFYPVVEVSVSIIENTLKGYVGAKGGLERNSFKKLTEMNPFILSAPPDEFTSTKYDFYGGLSTRIGRTIDWMVRFSGAGFDQMPFFVTDTSVQMNKDLENKFIPIYDDGSVFHGKTELVYQKTGHLRLSLAANYYSYKLDHEIEAWHKPSFDIAFAGKYNLQDKFLIGAELNYTGSSFAKSLINNEVVPYTLDGYFDMNLGFEYRYNKNLSGFFQVNNITNSSYYRWYNYASYRLNALIGVSYSF